MSKSIFKKSLICIVHCLRYYNFLFEYVKAYTENMVSCSQNIKRFSSVRRFHAWFFNWELIHNPSPAVCSLLLPWRIPQGIDTVLRIPTRKNIPSERIQPDFTNSLNQIFQHNGSKSQTTKPKLSGNKTSTSLWTQAFTPTRMGYLWLTCTYSNDLNGWSRIRKQTKTLPNLCFDKAFLGNSPSNLLIVMIIKKTAVHFWYIPTHQLLGRYETNKGKEWLLEFGTS